MFDKLKQLNELKQKAQKMQQALDAEVLEIVHRGVTVRISGGLEIKSLSTNGRSEDEIMAALNTAIKEAQKMAAKQMRGQMGDLGLGIPGL